MAGLALTRIQGLSHETTEIVHGTYPQTVTANRMKAHLNEISRSMLSVRIVPPVSAGCRAPALTQRILQDVSLMAW